jgi:hypothetical protein
MSIISEEINPVDKKSLEGSGEKIIETVEIGPYTAILVINKMGRYQIGLTSHKRSFTTRISQDRIPSKENTKTIMSMWSSLVDKIKEWTETYGEIHGGSMNPEKTTKYQRIFLRYGLNCSDIYQGNGGTGFVIYPN